MKRTIYFIALFLSVFVVRLEAQTETEARTFRGYIADNRIRISLERAGDKLSGSYQYKKIGADLQLAGTIDARGNFRLTESDARGAKTGAFTGQWIEEPTGSVALEGEWVNPKTGATLNFYAAEDMVRFAGDARLQSKTLTETNKPKLFDITAEYPVLSGVAADTATRFNRLVEKKVTETIAAFRKGRMDQTAADLKFIRDMKVNSFIDLNYRIKLADDRIISLVVDSTVFEGGAHPNHFTFPVNFDIEKAQEIKLADLFVPEANYLKIISDHSIAALKEKLVDMSDEDWIADGAGPKIENFGTWNITEKGILITFDPYQVAAYAAGSQEVLVPFDKLKDILKKPAVISGGAK